MLFFFLFFSISSRISHLLRILRFPMNLYLVYLKASHCLDYRLSHLRCISYLLFIVVNLHAEGDEVQCLFCKYGAFVLVLSFKEHTAAASLHLIKQVFLRVKRHGKLPSGQGPLTCQSYVNTKYNNIIRLSLEYTTS